MTVIVSMNVIMAVIMTVIVLVVVLVLMTMSVFRHCRCIHCTGS